MSHEATNWAIKQRGLKPTTRIVLWHLCDRFNPDYGCFPSQDRLAEDCEISRSTLNEHLALLEAAGLLRRVPRLHPVTRRQMPTRYILGFEPGFAPDDPEPCPESGHGTAGDPETRAGAAPVQPEPGERPGPCPESGHGNAARAVSGFPAEPCPENARSRVRNPDTNPVREPVSKPVKGAAGAIADGTATADRRESFLAELLAALGFEPGTALPAWWQGGSARRHVQRWREELGLSEQAILAIATASRRRHAVPPSGPKALDRAMQRAALRTGRARPTPSPRPGASSSEDELAAFYARLVNAPGYLPPSAISNRWRDAMLARGLVTAERLRERGVW